MIKEDGNALVSVSLVSWLREVITSAARARTAKYQNYNQSLLVFTVRRVGYAVVPHRPDFALLLSVLDFPLHLATRIATCVRVRIDRGARKIDRRKGRSSRIHERARGCSKASGIMKLGVVIMFESVLQVNPIF